MKIKKMNWQWVFLIFILFWGTVMFLNDPFSTTDLYRYYERFDIYSNFLNVKLLVMHMFETNIDFIFYSIIYIIAVLRLPKEALPLIILLIYYGSSMYIFRDTIAQSKLKTKNKYILLAILTLGTVYPYLLLSTLRFPLAISQLSLGIYLYYKNQKKKSLIFFLIALFSHFGTLYGIGIFLINQLLERKTFKRKRWMISYLTGIMGLYIFKFQINSIAFILKKIDLEFLAFKLFSYSQHTGLEHSGVGLGQITTLVFLIFIIIFIIDINVKTKNDRLVNYIKLLAFSIIICLFISPIITIRYTWMLTMFIPYIFIKYRVKSKYYLVLLVQFVYVMFIYRFYTYNIILNPLLG